MRASLKLIRLVVSIFFGFQIHYAMAEAKNEYLVLVKNDLGETVNGCLELYKMMFAEEVMVKNNQGWRQAKIDRGDQVGNEQSDRLSWGNTLLDLKIATKEQLESVDKTEKYIVESFRIAAESNKIEMWSKTNFIRPVEAAKVGCTQQAILKAKSQQ